MKKREDFIVKKHKKAYFYLFFKTRLLQNGELKQLGTLQYYFLIYESEDELKSLYKNKNISFKSQKTENKLISRGVRLKKYLAIDKYSFNHQDFSSFSTYICIKQLEKIWRSKHFLMLRYRVLSR